MRGPTATSLLVLTLCACSQVADPQGTTVHRASLQPLGTCSDVTTQVRERALREMNRQIDEALAGVLRQLAQGVCPGWDPYRGSTGGLPGVAVPTATTAGNTPPPPAAAPRGDAAGGGASSVSGTNNQVAGVDEADFIKNDDRYIYVAQGNSFRIVQAWPPEAASTLAKVQVEGEARRLFVTDTHALVYSSLPPKPTSGNNPGVPTPAGFVPPRGDRGGGECTYGYGCQFTGDGRPSKLTIFDISDRRAPVLVREIVADGSYVNARRIGSAVFTVLTSLRAPFARLPTWPSSAELPACNQSQLEDRFRAAFERLRESNRQEIEDTSLEGILPTVRQTLHRPGAAPQVNENVLADCQGFFAESVSDGDAFTTALALDLDEGESLQAATVYSRPGAVYASGPALYLAVPHERGGARDWYGEQGDPEELSTVHKFSLHTGGSAAVSYLGSGLVKGRVLNQFALDEHQGYLRVATTTGHLPDPKVHSTLSVLGEGEGGLEVVGQIDKLAPGEDIRSVRFDADRGYVVTFKKTDPLFVFDLADPRTPRLRGELKIPGFSTYMHRMDANHLLTIGYDAADQGNFAYFTGVLLQVFDVRDPAQPRLAHKEVIGTRGSSSEALTNHLAFTYFPPRDLLLLPMTVCQPPPGSNNLFGAQPTFSGLMAFKVTTAAGFSEKGRVAHPPGAGVTCGNWWTNASSQVKRSIVMDDWVFSVSGSQIKVNALDALGSDVAAVSLVD
jgi:hypothetical protein